MTWRYQPPALSPVVPAALLAGFVAAAGRSGVSTQPVMDELGRRYDASGVLLTNSGTSALVLALRMLLPKGGTVAYPGYACIDLTAAALQAGVRVRLYDIDPLTLSPDLDSLRKTVNRGVNAILVAHLYGYPADVDAVKELAVEKGIPVIEDAAQGAGGMLRGTRLGALADLSVLSFGRGKGTTAGSGGALLARTPGHAEQTLLIAGRLGERSRGALDVAALAAQWLLARPQLYRLPASIPALKLGEMIFHAAGEPRAISAAAEAMLPMALGTEERELAHRLIRAREFIGILGQTGGRLVPVHAIPRGSPGYLRLAFLDAAGDTALAPSVGVMRGYPLTLDQHEQLRPILAGGETAGKGSQCLRDNLLTAPTHSRVTVTDVGRFRQWLARSVSPVPLEVLAT